MTPKRILTLAVVTLGISIGCLSVNADPAPSGVFSLGSTGLAPLGLPDRDVVRDPYSGFLGSGGSFSGLVSQNVGVVGPNLGLGVGFSPGLILGGGGGGGMPTTFGMGAPSLPPVGGSSNSGTGGTLPLLVPAGGSTLPPAILPPSGPTTFSFLSLDVEEPGQAVAAVPDGGQSAIMLGAGLLMAFALQRRLSRKK